MTKWHAVIMKILHRKRLMAVGALLSVLCASSAALAQEQGLRVNIGIAAAKPGDPIDIPLTLSGGESGDVGSLQVQVGVPKRILEYTETERGLAVELADGDVQVSVADDQKDSSQSVVEFTAKAKSGSCIRPGILGYLKFNVSTDAQKGDVAFKLVNSQATACDGSAMQLAKGDDGQLTIFGLDEQIPVVGCFFFSH